MITEEQQNMKRAAKQEPERVIQTLISEPDHYIFKLRNYCEPIFVRLCNIALPHMEAYQADLCHDAVILSQAEAGDKFLWAWRSTGTCIISIKPHKRGTVEAIIPTCPAENYHLIEVVSKSLDVYANGYVGLLGATSHEQLVENFHMNIAMEGNK